jgi:hypothetical protein
MTIFTNINTPVVKPAGAPSTNAITAAGDGFNAQFNAKYLLRFANGSATPGNIVLNDPTSSNPGDATSFDPDVTISLPAGSVRTIRVDAARFRDSNGQVTWTYSANMTNAASLLEIYGPE